MPSEEAAKELWTMSSELFAVAMATLSAEILLSVVTNIILMVTIWSSPSLKTPPNSHLVNICVNNLLLVVCMGCSVVSLAWSGGATEDHVTKISGDIKVFLTVMCFLQYWCIFAAIGHYRSRTLRKPSMSLKVRRKVIVRTILAGWLVSSALSLALVLCFKMDISVVSWNAFRRTINSTEAEALSRPNPGQTAMLVLTFLTIVICLAVITSSYYYIMKTLVAAQPVCKNKVSPWVRSSSVSSDDNDLILNKRSYRPDSEVNGTWSKGPFTISKGNVADNFVVHYSKRAQSLTTEEVCALENPIRAHCEYEAHRQLRATLSNTTIQGAGGGGGFTDISPGAELQRFQRMKNSCALRNQSWRRDRVSLSSATKNSLVMVTAFVFSSLLLCVCSVPGVLSSTSTSHLTTTLLFCQLVFYLNAPAYPIWYLIFSKQVRKCLHTLCENTLIKMKIRQ